MSRESGGLARDGEGGGLHPAASLRQGRDMTREEALGTLNNQWINNQWNKH